MARWRRTGTDPRTNRHDRRITGRVIGAMVGPLVPPVVDHVDVDGVLDRVDLNAVVERIDLNAVLERVDVNALIERTELGSIISRSTSSVFLKVLDGARSISVTLDEILHDIVDRVLRRRGGVPHVEGSVTAPEHGLVLLGKPAGIVTR